MTHYAEAASNPLVKLHVPADTTLPRFRPRVDGVLVGVALMVVAWAGMAAMVVAALAPLANVVH